ERRKLRVGGAERIVAGRHEDASLQVDNGDRDAPDLADPSPAAGRPRRIIGGPQQPMFFLDVTDDLFLFVNMVAGRHAIDSGGEEIFGNARRNGKTGGGVLYI